MNEDVEKQFQELLARGWLPRAVRPAETELDKIKRLRREYVREPTARMRAVGSRVIVHFPPHLRAPGLPRFLRLCFVPAHMNLYRDF